MKKRIVILVIAVTQIVVLTSLSLSMGVIKETPDDLLPAAEKILRETFQKFIMIKRGVSPYFQAWEDLMDFRLGEPIPSYKLHMDIIYGLKDNDDFKDALEFLVWDIPIYLGDEEMPRTLLGVNRDSDGKWRFARMGRYAQHIVKARKSWPAEEGYRHADIFGSTGILMIMLEKDGQLQFYFYGDEWGERIFGISKNEDGSYPLFSRDYLIKVVKSDRKYMKPGVH